MIFFPKKTRTLMPLVSENAFIQKSVNSFTHSKSEVSKEN